MVPEAHHSPPACLVLVNYNNWRDTVACIKSLQGMPCQVFIVVNGTNPEDGLCLLDACSELGPVTSIDEANFLAGPVDPGLTLVTARNRGFAAANNVILKKFIDTETFRYFWVLNNDTTAAPGALEALIAHYEAHLRGGFLGVQTLEADGCTLQSMGARYSKVFGTGRYNTSGEAVPDFITGSSIFLDGATLRRVGLMDESYFLYNEDIDWSIRCRRLGLPLGVCSTTWICHKEGASIGTAKTHGSRSDLSDFYSLRNRLLLIKKHHQAYYPVAVLSLILPFINRLLHGQPRRAMRVFEALAQAMASHED